MKAYLISMLSMNMDLDASEMMDLNQTLPELEYNRELNKFENILNQNSVYNDQILEDLVSVKDLEIESLSEAKERLRIVEEHSQNIAELMKRNEDRSEDFSFKRAEIDSRKVEMSNLDKEADEFKSRISERESEVAALKIR